MSLDTVVFLAALVGAAWVAWRRGAYGYALGFAAVALLPAGTLLRAVSWPGVALVVALLAPVVWHRFARTSATVARWGARARRKDGVASTVDIIRVASGWAMRRKAGTVRPSLAVRGRGWRARWARCAQLWRLPTVEVAVELCRVGRLRVWSSIEDVVLVFGGPRTGKTQWLAGRILDAPGAVVVTSTRTDLLTQTAPLRAQRGPVYVFNAVGLGDIPSTITFDPLTGCADPVTAAERATDMVAAGSRASSGDREFWDGQARRVLAALLHAAALARPDEGVGMRDVLRWVADPEDAKRQVTSLLRRSSEPAFVSDATQFVTTNDKTRSSITSTIMPALGWLTSPTASAAAAPSAAPFDVAELLRTKASVYLLGGEETHTAPLVCALTGHIAREARRIAARQPSGRLDPPLGLKLDEVALTSPVPLESWTSDMGGRGVSIVCAFQSRAQLLARWGEHDSATILNNAGGRVLLGCGDRDDLTYWSTLAGERDEPVLTTDLHGRVVSRTVRKVPVLAPAQLADLRGKVVVFRRGMPPVIGRAEQAWQRRDVRAHTHATEAAGAEAAEAAGAEAAEADRAQAGADRWSRVRAVATRLRPNRAERAGHPERVVVLTRELPAGLPGDADWHPNRDRRTDSTDSTDSTADANGARR